MSSAAPRELFDVFNARRVKAPELKGLDIAAHGLVGMVQNRLPVLQRLKAAADRIEKLEPKVKDFNSTRFQEEVASVRDLARLGRLEGESLDYAVALAREAAVRTVGKRPFPVQLMGALGITQGRVVEMATGEGKTLTAAIAASIWAWSGKPVHVITVNDYLVARDAELNRPLYEMLGHRVAHVTHETQPWDRLAAYRSSIVYITSKELVADFLRDQIMLGNLRTSTQTVVQMLGGPSMRGQVLVPGLFRAIVDEADSLLIDEAVTPLIISNSPDDEANASLYRAADELALQLEEHRDFKIDTEVRQVDLTERGKDKLADLSDESGFWKGARRREELVTQALVARYCFHKDEHYMITAEQKIAIIDEFTGRVMADRSWRHGLHQAIEVKENVPVTADKENLARLSFQRFFRQYPIMGGMTGTVWESRGEMWQIYNRALVRIPTNRPCIRKQLPMRFFDTSDQKWTAVVKRICELNDKGIPVLVGTRSVWASEEVSKRLTDAGRPHNVLNARHDAREASIISEAGQLGKITVATNMAGRGTDIHLARGVTDLGGLHVIATEPHGSGRVDRQLFGRAGRQGDPGCAQMFACAEDDLLLRHATHIRKAWRVIGAKRVIQIAQAKAERLARFNRKQVLRSDDWMDQSLPF